MSDETTMDLISRLRGSHVNPLRYVPGIQNMPPADSPPAWQEIERLQKLCLEAADEIERLQIEANALRERLKLTYDIQVGIDAAGSPNDMPATSIKWDISR